MPLRPDDRWTRRSASSWAASFSIPSGSAHCRQYSTARQKSGHVRCRASSTSSASSRAKNSAVRPAASDASTAACRWLMSPAANALAVAGMVRNRRPNHAWARACPSGNRQRCATHAPQLRDPSSAHTRRASIAAVNRAVAAASRACCRCSPTTASANSASSSVSGSRVTSASIADVNDARASASDASTATPPSPYIRSYHSPQRHPVPGPFVTIQWLLATRSAHLMRGSWSGNRATATSRNRPTGMSGTA